MGPFRVASTHALPVGVVRWPDDRALSVVLKATFSLAAGGAVSFAAEQMPVSVERVGTKGVPGGLDYPSDFAPFKPDADVLVVGHARQLEAATSLPVRVQVGKWGRLLVASTTTPVHELSLSPARLRDGATGEEALAGPSALSAPLEGTPEWFEPGFDFGQFNSAPFEQLIPWIAPGSKVVIDGVFRDGRRRAVKLPRVRPHAAVVSLEEGIVDVQPMAADTLWIDGDAEVCVVVWRSVHRFSRSLESTPRIVTVEDPLESLDDYVALARAAPTSLVATEISHFAHAPGRAFGVPIAAPLRSSELGAPMEVEDWETLVGIPAVDANDEPPFLQRTNTQELQAVAAPPALPFAATTHDPLVGTIKMSPAEEVTLVGPPGPPAAAEGASRSSGLPFVPARTSLSVTDETADDDERSGLAGVLPFSGRGQGATPIPAVPPARESSGTITDIINLDELMRGRLPSDDDAPPTPKMVVEKAGLGGRSLKTSLGTMRLGSAPPVSPPAAVAPPPVAPPPVAPPPIVMPAAVAARPPPPALGGPVGSGPTLASSNAAAAATIGQGASVGGAAVLGPGLPSPGAPVEELASAGADSPRLTIEKYAELKAELWQGAASRGQVLDKYGFSEIAWKAEDEHWRGRLSEESKRGEAELVRIVTTALMKRR